MHRKLISK